MPHEGKSMTRSAFESVGWHRLRSLLIELHASLGFHIAVVGLSVLLLLAMSVARASATTLMLNPTTQNGECNSQCTSDGEGHCVCPTPTATPTACGGDHNFDGV